MNISCTKMLYGSVLFFVVVCNYFHLIHGKSSIIPKLLAPEEEGGDIPDPEGREISDPEGGDIPDPEGREISDPEGGDISDPEGGDIPDPEGGDIPDPEGGDIPDPEGGEIPDPKPSCEEINFDKDGVLDTLNGIRSNAALGKPLVEGGITIEKKCIPNQMNALRWSDILEENAKQLSKCPQPITPLSAYGTEEIKNVVSEVMFHYEEDNTTDEMKEVNDMINENVLDELETFEFPDDFNKARETVDVVGYKMIDILFDELYEVGCVYNKGQISVPGRNESDLNVYSLLCLFGLKRDPGNDFTPWNKGGAACSKCKEDRPCDESTKLCNIDAIPKIKKDEAEEYETTTAGHGGGDEGHGGGDEVTEGEENPDPGHGGDEDKLKPESGQGPSSRIIPATMNYSIFCTLVMGLLIKNI